MTIHVSQITGKHAVTLADGDKLYEVLHEELSKGAKVELDFLGVDVIASPFLNAAIGRLYSDFSSDKLNELLTCPNLSRTGKRLMKQVIMNSKKFYSTPQSERDMYNKIIIQSLDQN